MHSLLEQTDSTVWETRGTKRRAQVRWPQSTISRLGIIFSPLCIVCFLSASFFLLSASFFLLSASFFLLSVNELTDTHCIMGSNVTTFISNDTRKTSVETRKSGAETRIPVRRREKGHAETRKKWCERRKRA